MRVIAGRVTCSARASVAHRARARVDEDGEHREPLRAQAAVTASETRARRSAWIAVVFELVGDPVAAAVDARPGREWRDVTTQAR